MEPAKPSAIYTSKIVMKCAHYPVSSWFHHTFLVFLLTGWTSSGATGGDHPMESDLGSFRMKDQFGQEYTETSFEKPVLVFVCGDRKGSEYTTKWRESLNNGLSETQRKNVRFVDVACLQTVPFFLKGFVRKQFPQDRSQWTLMDWDGVLAKRFSFEDDKCNIVAFDERRRLIFQKAVLDINPSLLYDFFARITASIPGDRDPME